MSVAPRTSLLEAKKKQWAAQADMSLSVNRTPLPSLSVTRHSATQVSSREHYVPYPEHKKQPVAVKTRSFCASFDK